mmetsp:Transcript_16559/g.33308  ORF Transcript_16559/g.33308 Transcript_16559/m.33308 type:complete len:93 (-) Transcript_16559:2056-2334(-)
MRTTCSTVPGLVEGLGGFEAMVGGEGEAEGGGDGDDEGGAYDEGRVFGGDSTGGAAGKEGGIQLYVVGREGTSPSSGAPVIKPLQVSVRDEA